MLEELSRAVYPRKCPGCRDVIFPDMLVGDCCRNKFKRIREPSCMKCGRHIQYEEDDLCTQCKSKNHHYISGMSVFSYEGAVRTAMSDLKYSSVSENAEFFADEAVKHCGSRIKAFDPDIIVPVPIHSRRRALRGYNQAELIAEGIASAVKIPLVSDLLIRNKNTKAQKILDASARSGNVKNAFVCDMDRYNQDYISDHFGKVLLIDDIYTTGNTMENCTCALLEAGVAEVCILSIAIGSSYN